jgi:hypothetical protein
MMALAVAFIADDTAAIGIPMTLWTASLFAGAGVTLVLLYLFLGSMNIM